MKCPKTPKGISALLLRIGFGGALALFGLAHYLDMQGFSAMVTGGFTGVFAVLAGIWVYILPLLMIVGGILLVIAYRLDIALWCAGIALVSIAVGMALKLAVGNITDPAVAAQVAQAVHNALLWLIVYAMVVHLGHGD